VSQEGLEDDLMSFVMFDGGAKATSKWKVAIKNNFDWDSPPSLTAIARRANEGYYKSNLDLDDDL
jgi:hypothetical protein